MTQPYCGCMRFPLHVSQIQFSHKVSHVRAATQTPPHLSSDHYPNTQQYVSPTSFFFNLSVPSE